jgi:hypothetical protein
MYILIPKIPDSEILPIIANGSSAAHFQATPPDYSIRTPYKNMPTMSPRILDNTHFTIRAQ